MKLNRSLIQITAIVLALFASDFSVLAQLTEQQWQAKAVEKYPSLKIKGSNLNRRFVDAYTARRKGNPDFFKNPRWPLVLADELVSGQSATPLSTPSDAPLNSRSQPATLITSVKSDGTAAHSVQPSTNSHSSSQAAIQPATPTDSAQPIWIFVMVASGLVALGILLSAVGAGKRRKHRARVFGDARKYLELVHQGHALPSVASSLILKAGESAFYSAASALYETRAVRHYQSGFTGFRIAKGIYIGGSRGRSTSSQEWSKIDSGSLTITNKRLIFDGGSEDRTVLLSKVISADPNRDSVEVSVENRQKSMIYAAANPLILATIIRICSSVENPLDLSQTSLDITFLE